MNKYTDLRARPRLDLAATSPLPCPLTLYVDPTSFCNFKCVQCPVGQAEYHVSPTMISVETMDRIAGEVLEMGRLKSLKLYLQGEPLLHPKIEELILAAKRCSDRVEITSNCSVLSAAKASSLVSSELDYLQVSVYGASESQHHTVTNSPISAEKVRCNVQALRSMRDQLGKSKPFIFARFFHDTPLNEAEFLRLWEPIADECGFDTAHNWDGQINLREKLYGIAEQPAASDIPCAFPFYTLTVKADGAVTVCCVDWSDSAEVGNIHQESLVSIWRGERLKQFRMMHLDRRRGENAACRNCRLPERSPDSIESLTSETFSKRLL